MSDARTAAGTAHRVGSGAGRLVRAWRNLAHERRLAAFAAVGLFLTLFLPWYQETVLLASGAKGPVAASASVTGWGAFSFVEAAVLLVAAGVLVLLFQRAEGKAFHLPGGDGWVITAAGFWTGMLIVWRIFDKQSTDIRGPGADISGIEWGIFVALAVAAFLAYAGSRIRAAHQPEPPLPGEDSQPDAGPIAPSRQRRRATTPRPVAAAGAAAPPEAEPIPSRRPRLDVTPAERPRPVGVPVAGEDWGHPSTDWIDATRRRPSRPDPDQPPTQRNAHDDPATERIARGEDDPTQRIARGEDDPATERIARGEDDPATERIARREDDPTQRIARDQPPVSGNGAQDAPTNPLGPSTQAARRSPRPDDQLTIPLERED